MVSPSDDNNDQEPTRSTAEDEQIRARLDHLKHRLDDLSGSDSRSKSDKRTVSSNRQAIGRALRLGTEFVAGVAVGGFIGYWIDRLLGISPFGFVVFFLFGIATGFLNVFRTAREIQQEQTQQVARGELDLGRDLPEDDDEN